MLELCGQIGRCIWWASADDLEVEGIMISEIQGYHWAHLDEEITKIHPKFTFDLRNTSKPPSTSHLLMKPIHNLSDKLHISSTPAAGKRAKRTQRRNFRNFHANMQFMGQFLDRNNWGNVGNLGPYSWIQRPPLYRHTERICYRLSRLKICSQLCKLKDSLCSQNRYTCIRSSMA